jgi:hypothetical protein
MTPIATNAYPSDLPNTVTSQLQRYASTEEAGLCETVAERSVHESLSLCRTWSPDRQHRRIDQHRFGRFSESRAANCRLLRSRPHDHRGFSISQIGFAARRAGIINLRPVWTELGRALLFGVIGESKNVAERTVPARG